VGSVTAGDRAVMSVGDVLGRLRRACLALPEVEERLSHGEPAWFVRGKRMFVSFADRHHDDRVACWCAAPAGAQEALVANYPERFFRPPYVGHRGWLGVYLDVPIDWDEVEELVVDAYQVVAPKRLAQRVRGPSSRDVRPGGAPAERVAAQEGIAVSTSDTPRPYTKHHKDGTVWARGQTIDGVPTGYWEWFRADGTRLRSGHFRDGIQVGEWTTYDRSGSVYKVTDMKTGKRGAQKTTVE